MTLKNPLFTTWLTSGHRLEVVVVPLDGAGPWSYRLVATIYAPAGDSVGTDYCEAGVIVGHSADAVEDCHPTVEIVVVRIGGDLSPADDLLSGLQLPAA